MKSFVVASILSVAAFSAHAVAPTHYSVAYLNGLVGSDLNNSGQVVGGFISGANSGLAGVYYKGVAQTIAGLDEPGFAYGINNAGQIVGQSGWNNQNSFKYSGGSITMLNQTPGAETFAATDIDGAGNVAGTIVRDYGNSGFYAVQMAKYVDGTIFTENLGGQVTRVFGVSEGGIMYGHTSTPDGLVAFTYENGTVTEYSSVLGNFSAIGGVNDHGQMVGINMGASNFPSYFISEGVPRYAGDNIGLGGLNNAGWAVGFKNLVEQDGSVSTGTGLLWIDGVSYDLNALIDPALGWTITSATKINDGNQILAEGCNASGCGSVLLSPLAAVPEPETYGMMLLGIGTVGLFARRRRKVATV